MQVAQRSGGVSLYGDAQKLSGHGPRQLALGSSVQAWDLDQMISKVHLEPHTL